MKNKTKVYFSIFLVMAALVVPVQLSCKSTSLSTSLSQINQNMQQRTVQIVFITHHSDSVSTTDYTYPAGTGLLVNDDGYVITANHLLDMGEQFAQQSQAQAEIKKLAIEIQTPSNIRSMPSAFPIWTNDFDVIARDEKHDLALLKIKMTTGVSPLNGEILHTVHYRDGSSSGTLNLGDAPFATIISRNSSIAMTGYPSYKMDGGLATKTGKVTSGEITNIGYSHLTDATGLAVSSLNVIYSMTDYYQTDITSNTLFSGSPVYSIKNGAILGMCINIADSSETSVIIPSRYILDLLKNNKVKI